MATQILMPALSPTMEEGTLAKWLVKEGDAVKSGQIIAEIETDKATMEFEAVDEGIVGKILVAEGTAGVKVNTPIAVLVEEGESVPAAVAAVRLPPPAACPGGAAAGASAAPAPGSCRCHRSRRRADLRLAAGAADRQGKGRRSGGREGLWPAWPDRQGRCRGGKAGRGAAAAATAAASPAAHRRLPRRRRRCPPAWRPRRC
jgi:pyruvate dehydrogenase E2 component (dihydrolipoamide acetyltransferase)